MINKTLFNQLMVLVALVLAASMSMIACEDDDDEDEDAAQNTDPQGTGGAMATDTAVSTGTDSVNNGTGAPTTDSGGSSDTGPAVDTSQDPALFCPGGAAALQDTAMGKVCNMTGVITGDHTLRADILYYFSGIVFIGDDVGESSLTIPAGTTLYGDASTASDNPSSIVIQRNSKIFANGTATAPITFTSSMEPGQRNHGDWGGLVLNGNAKINACNDPNTACTLPGEGETGTYGGLDDADSSGSLTYVRIEFSGRQITPEVEMNGLALQAVGSGTTIEYIQIHRTADDSIEFFGGAAEVKYMVLSGTQDDGFDWTTGWRGKAQFVVVNQFNSMPADQGIEADNLENNEDYLPRSAPQLYNFSMLGDPNSVEDNGGVKLRRGTSATLKNFIIQGYRTKCLNIDTDATWAQYAAGTVIIENSIMSPTCPFADDDETGANFESAVWSAGTGNSVADPMLSDPNNELVPNYMPAASSSALTGAATVPADGFFEQVDFIGAMGATDWTAGWTAYPKD